MCTQQLRVAVSVIRSQQIEQSISELIESKCAGPEVGLDGELEGVSEITEDEEETGDVAESKGTDALECIDEVFELDDKTRLAAERVTRPVWADVVAGSSVSVLTEPSPSSSSQASPMAVPTMVDMVV